MLSFFPFFATCENKLWFEKFASTRFESRYAWNGRYLSFTVDTWYWIDNCLFKNIQPYGAVRFTNTISTMCMLLSDTVFHSCFSNDDNFAGGSFYWREEGQFAEYGVCYYNSYSSKNGQVFGITVSKSKYATNHHNMSTFSQIGRGVDSGNFLAGIASGEIIFINNNMSFCYNQEHAGINSANVLYDSLWKQSQFKNFSSSNILFNPGQSNQQRTHNAILCNFMYCKGNSLFQSDTKYLNIVSCIIKDNKVRTLIGVRSDYIVNVNDTYSSSNFPSNAVVENPRVESEELTLSLLDFTVCDRTPYYQDSLKLEKVSRKAIGAALAQIPSMASSREGSYI